MFQSTGAASMASSPSNQEYTTQRSSKVWCTCRSTLNPLQSQELQATRRMPLDCHNCLRLGVPTSDLPCRVGSECRVVCFVLSKAFCLVRRGQGSHTVQQWVCEISLVTTFREKSWVIEQEPLFGRMRTCFYLDASVHDRFCDPRVVEHPHRVQVPGPPEHYPPSLKPNPLPDDNFV